MVAYHIGPSVIKKVLYKRKKIYKKTSYICHVKIYGHLIFLLPNCFYYCSSGRILFALKATVFFQLLGNVVVIITDAPQVFRILK